MITFWTTTSNLNRFIGRAVYDGLRRIGIPARLVPASSYDGRPVPSVSYGFLRGTGNIYRDCERAGIPWWNVDRGFFGERSPAGFFRLGFRHLQPRFVPRLQLDGTRRGALGIRIEPWREPGGMILLCPPTPLTAGFYGTTPEAWLATTRRLLPREKWSQRVRAKGDRTPLERDLQRARAVVTHSSNVALEALVAGVPAVASEGFVRSWNGLRPADVEVDQTALDREALVTQATWHQFTLDEFRSGFAWRTWETIHGVSLREAA